MGRHLTHKVAEMVPVGMMSMMMPVAVAVAVAVAVSFVHVALAAVVYIVCTLPIL